MSETKTLKQFLDEWNTYKAEAASGHITFDPAAAKAVVAALNAYIAEMKAVKASAQKLLEMEGFGDFKSADEARLHYIEQARKWIAQADTCIKTGEAMRDAVQDAGNKTEEQEAANQGRVGQSGPR